jgi:hypothetical protein
MGIAEGRGNRCSPLAMAMAMAMAMAKGRKPGARVADFASVLAPTTLDRYALFVPSPPAFSL